MRRILIGASLVLALATSVICAGSETGTGQQAAEASAVKKPEIAKKTTAHHPARGEYRKAAVKKAAKREDYRPDYNQNAVEVMNGSSTTRVVFDQEDKADEAAKTDPSQLKVEVMNGSSTDTRYFHLDPNAPEQAAITNEPVVIGVQSSDTRFFGGNRHPVVTGITSAGQHDAMKVGGGGQKLTNGISPQPKRPLYDPDAH
jgi:hypothetical protein